MFNQSNDEPLTKHPDMCSGFIDIRIHIIIPTFNRSHVTGLFRDVQKLKLFSRLHEVPLLHAMLG